MLTCIGGGTQSVTQNLSIIMSTNSLCHHQIGLLQEHCPAIIIWSLFSINKKKKKRRRQLLTVEASKLTKRCKSGSDSEVDQILNEPVL